MSDCATIDAAEAAVLLQSCNACPLAIAVSGGVDSMVLLHLVSIWRANGGGAAQPPPLILTVDHGLRSESAYEAAFVGARARDLGFEHRTLLWTGPKPATGIQAAARAARYDLLLNALARTADRRDLLLAHHLDDQAETFLMRLARGSGIDGLSAMRPRQARVAVQLSHPVSEVLLHISRPLLEVPKVRMLATAEAMALTWCSDPSNDDLTFERVRLRKSMPLLAAVGLTPVSLARAARRQTAERDAAQARARAIAAAHLRDHDGAYAELQLPLHQLPPPADLCRLLARMLEVYGGTAWPAQLSQIETLVDRVAQAPSAARDRTTLGGCLIEISDRGEHRRVTVMREDDRRPLPTCTIDPGGGVFWDRRFYISCAPDAAAPVTILPANDAVNCANSCWTGTVRAGLPAILTAGGPKLLFGHSTDLVTCRWPPQHRAKLYFTATD